MVLGGLSPVMDSSLNLKPSPEFAFSLCCSMFPNIDIEKLDSLLTQDFNWDLLLYQVMCHNIYPQVHKTIGLLNSSKIPDHFVQQIYDNYKRNSFRNIALSGEILRVNQALKDNEINTVVLKGIPLALNLYDDISMRPSGDIDLLIDPSDFVAAENVLIQLNYQRVFPNKSVPVEKYKYFFNIGHHFYYINLERGINIELHWKASDYKIEGLLFLQEFETEDIDVWGYPVSTFSNEDLLIYLIMHGSHHMWSRLRWLVDVGILLQKKINWERLVKKINRIDNNSIVELMFHMTFIVLNQLLYIPVPSYINKSVSNNKKARELSNLIIYQLYYGSHGMKSNRLEAIKLFFQNYYYNISFKIRFKNKVIYTYRKIFSQLHPNDFDYWTRLRVSLPENLFWLSIVIRPLYWLKIVLFNNCKLPINGKRRSRNG